jgi:thiamine kinase-like enzyme
MPPDVAFALGEFFQAARVGGVGLAHGDCAPWNLLRDDAGWALIDWENAMEGMPPFYDLFHFLVQSTIELRRPSRKSIVEGLELRGPVGRIVRAYADGSRVGPRASKEMFVDYLRRSIDMVEPGAPDRARRIRRELYAMVTT